MGTGARIEFIAIFRGVEWRSLCAKAFFSACLCSGCRCHSANATDNGVRAVYCRPECWESERRDCRMERYDSAVQFGNRHEGKCLSVGSGTNAAKRRLVAVDLLRQKYCSSGCRCEHRERCNSRQRRSMPTSGSWSIVELI